MRRLVFHPEATDDLAGIWRFTDVRWGAAQADSYTAGLITMLGDFPDTPPQARQCDDLYPGLLRLRYCAHFVFFLSDAEKMTIVRILHERMDHARQLRDLIEDDGPPGNG